MFFLCIYEFKTNKVVYSGLHEVGGVKVNSIPQKNANLCHSLNSVRLCSLGCCYFFLLFNSKTEVLEPLNTFKRMPEC